MVCNDPLRIGIVMKKLASDALGKDNGCTVTFYRNSMEVALLCLAMALIPQLLGITRFKHLPSWAAVTDLTMYALGVTMGCLLACVALKVISSPSQTSGNVKYVFHCRLTEKQLLLLTTICFIPLLPDSILAFVMSQLQENVRYSLLTDSSTRILDPKWIMVLSQPVVLLVWFYVVFVNPKKLWITVAMIILFLMETFIWASRTEFVLLGFFYLVNCKKLLTKKNIILSVGIFVFMSFYTIFIQGRADLAGYIESTIFYSVYFAYPIYLHSFIPAVFNDLTIPYALFGYPADVIETYMAGMNMIARHLDEIATYSVIGEDVRGIVHEHANVLYPHYGFLGFTLGHLGVFIYYAFAVAVICIMAEKFRRYLFTWRILIFIFIYSSSRAFAFGVPSNWFFLIFAFLFCLVFMKVATSAKV